MTDPAEPAEAAAADAGSAADVAGLLLAAGEGTRLGRPKALVEVGGERLADRGVRLLTAAGCRPVTVVLGAAVTDVPGARVVVNPDWPSGMGSSLRVGLAAMPESADAVVIALVDQPGIGVEVLHRLLRAYRAGGDAAVAAYQGAPRNPVLLAREHWTAAARDAVGDTGARRFLRARPELVTLVECGDIATPADVDTPEDLARLTARG